MCQDGVRLLSAASFSTLAARRAFKRRVISLLISLLVYRPFDTRVPRCRVANSPVCRGGPMKILRADRGRLPSTLVLVPLLLLLAACAPASPQSPASSSQTGARPTTPK